MTKKQKTVGILGGKGPEATSLLFQRIVENTRVQVEEDHLRVIIDNNPKIPKPALGITGEGPDPVPALVETAQNLERAGADFLVIACNSAHYYVAEIESAISIPVVSIITETVASVQRSSCKKVGILATTGLIDSQIYQKAFEKAGIAAMCPNDRDQIRLTAEIMDFKNTGDRDGLRTVVDRISSDYESRGAECLVVACTDIPAAVDLRELSLPWIDTIEVLAKAAVREATGAS